MTITQSYLHEATNKDIKRTKVLWDNQKLGTFLTNALEIVKGWSKKDDSRLFCESEAGKLKGISICSG